MDADLQDLKDRIQAAEERQSSELTEKGQIPILPLSEWLSEEDWNQLWLIVRRLRREHVDAAIRFPEDALPGLVVDLVAQEDAGLTLDDLARALVSLATAEGPWLVATPIANIELEEPVIEVAPQTVLWRAVMGHP